jgi:phthiocerol/phenolphthiocerol synthesis type-I polyketide synthase C
MSTTAANCHTLVDHFRSMFADRPGRQAFRFVSDSGGEPLALSNADLDLRARAIAGALSQRCAVGDRALIVCPPGLDYIAAFFGCLYAGVIAVPVYPPDPVLLNRTLPRLVGVIEDARPRVALTTTQLGAVASFIAGRAPALARLEQIAVDRLDPAAAQAWTRPPIVGGDLAFLQYTSGSTGQPKGVKVTHDNLRHNLEGIGRRFLGGAPHTGDDRYGGLVTWLPPYHDMGLIGTLLAPAYQGQSVIAMSPEAFMKRPFRWLKVMSDYRGTVSGGPNFAYERCLAKVSDAERATLDLSSWRVAFSGAEAVRADTLARFGDAFASTGFRRRAFLPCYGLAEATLCVSSGAAVTRSVDTAQLTAGRARQVPVEVPTARVMVSCGPVMDGEQVVIVDPDERTRRADRRVGEIWVRGPSVCAGYWNRPEASAATFSAELADTGDGPFLRTGDLGYLDDGQLYVVGRMKDVIIISGRNHYPQDIEQSVEHVDRVLRPGCGAAFSVEVDDQERLVIVQEVSKDAIGADTARVLPAIRATVAREHGLRVHEVVLVSPGSVPKTSSGKIRRSTCKGAFLADTLTDVARWSSAPRVGVQRLDAR